MLVLQYLIWSFLWLAWNLFLICLYLSVGILTKVCNCIQLIFTLQYNRVRTIPLMATIPDTRGQSIPILDTDTESDVIGVLYSSVNSAPKHVCHPADSLAFVMRASRHEVGGLWSIYNQWQWKCFTCCRQHRAMLIGRWYVLDCQDRSGQSGGSTVNEQRRLAWT